MKIIAIDLGDVRTGVAISDKNEMLASPLCVITEKNRNELLKKINSIIVEHDIKKIILGLPKNMDGSEGNSAKKSHKFKLMLEKSTNIPVILQDERSTTVLSNTYLNAVNIKSGKRKKIVDSVAATIILQDYLDYNNKK